MLSLCHIQVTTLLCSERFENVCFLSFLTHWQITGDVNTYEDLSVYVNSESAIAVLG